MSRLKSRGPLFCALIAALSLPSLPADAQYKWRDKVGVVQYSDMPPPAGTAEKDVLQQPAATSRKSAVGAASGAKAVSANAPALGVTVTSAPAKSGEPELDAKLRKAEQDKAARSKAEADKQVAARAENCARAKAYQRNLDEGLRITRTDLKGEREILDEKSLAEEARRTKAVIANDCK